MKTISILTLITVCFIINFAFCEPFTNFYHNTGSVSLRVDDTYLGGFLYHNMHDATHDNLWISFIAVYTEKQMDLTTIDTILASGPLFYEDSFYSDFRLLSSLTAEEDSFHQKSEIQYIDTSNFKIIQAVYSELVDQYWIKLSLTFKNITDKVFNNTKVLLFYDGDIPNDDYYDDYMGKDTLFKSVYVYDLTHSILSGFSWIRGGTFVSTGNFEYWYEETDKPQKLREFFAEPLWSGYSNTDCAVYEVIALDSIAAPGDSQTVEFGFISGIDFETFQSTCIDLHGDSTSIFINISNPAKFDISIYPNPFNDVVFITNNGNGLIDQVEIFNLLGERVFSHPNLNSSKLIWQGQNQEGIGVTGGIYLINIKIKNEEITRKIVYLK